mgnify:CR=1 FL=1
MFGGFIKRNKTDALFSDIVRARAGYICERCKRDFNHDHQKFDCSHFYSRKNVRVRWNFLNASALCRGCHIYFGEHPYEHTEFMKAKLGKDFDRLTIEANQRKLSSAKIDEKMVRLGLKMEWDKLIKEQKSKILGAR